MDLKMDVLQHVAFEGLAEIEKWCRLSGTDYVVHKIFDQGAMPNAEDTAFLVVLGGPMSVLDDLPLLEAERQLIRELITLRNWSFSSGTGNSSGCLRERSAFFQVWSVPTKASFTTVM